MYDKNKKEKVIYRLTTVDNPYDPFTQFNDWFAFDTMMNYNSCSYVERIVDQLSKEKPKEFDQTKLINEAVEQIVNLNILGIYKKVSKTFKKVDNITLTNN